MIRAVNQHVARGGVIALIPTNRLVLLVFILSII